jgi:GNAT superfamily N-acetyltransferase
MQLTIRRYELHDHQAVLRLHRDGLQQMSADAGPGLWDADLDDIERTYLNAGGDFVVGLVGEEVVAMGALRRVTGTTADLKRLRVKRELQGNGVGERIARLLVERARELGFGRLGDRVGQRSRMLPGGARSREAIREARVLAADD